MKFLLAATLLISSILCAADDVRLKPFNDAVAKYAAIQKTAVAKAPALPKEATPEQIVAQENSLVATIRLARPRAKQGDVFTPAVLPIFQKIIKDYLSGSVNKENRDTAKQGNPKYQKEKGEKDPVMKVSAIYPKSASLSSVPPGLLAALPVLPMHIEYRFVGSTLVLWDNLSNLIIDYIPGAAPSL
ncbi:MAG: hypothetical protein ABI811_16835 [Acidobacteriota bacterium]